MSAQPAPRLPGEPPIADPLSEAERQFEVCLRAGAQADWQAALRLIFTLEGELFRRRAADV